MGDVFAPLVLAFLGGIAALFSARHDARREREERRHETSDGRHVLPLSPEIPQADVLRQQRPIEGGTGLPSGVGVGDSQQPGSGVGVPAVPVSIDAPAWVPPPQPELEPMPMSALADSHVQLVATACPACLCAAREPDEDDAKPVEWLPGRYGVAHTCSHHRRMLAMLYGDEDEQTAVLMGLGYYAKRSSARRQA